MGLKLGLGVVVLVSEHKKRFKDASVHPNPIQEIGDPAPDIWVWGLEPGLGKKAQRQHCIF